MHEILVDSNVILDIFTEDKQWFHWSSNKLSQFAEKTNIHINNIIYSEISAAFDSIEDLENAIPQDFIRSEIPWEAAFLAAKVYQKYRRQGGIKSRPLPDFFIGAHAAISGFSLLTRDPKPYQHYFRNLKIISPHH